MHGKAHSYIHTYTNYVWVMEILLACSSLAIFHTNQTMLTMLKHTQFVIM